ncbi:Beta-galactosidase [Bienertia sinuspersici]
MLSTSLLRGRSTILKKGKNVIALLSVTIGLQNYGPHFDLQQVGITGPVKLFGRRDNDLVVKDLSRNVWSYKTGLRGIDHEKLFRERPRYVNTWRTNGDTPLNTRMTWYKTSFKAPLGNDPVVVDLTGLGKGEAWVNGKSIGRYWLTYLADENGCSLAPCDYRGPYDNNKCVTNCGKPVPRTTIFPKGGREYPCPIRGIGGNPSQIKFKTISVGKACANAYEGNTLELTCDGRPISAIKFASFGNPQGVCGAFQRGSCESANDVQSILTKACVGQETCLVDVSEKTFGEGKSCGTEVKRLAVEFVVNHSK